MALLPVLALQGCGMLGGGKAGERTVTDTLHVQFTELDSSLSARILMQPDTGTAGSSTSGLGADPDPAADPATATDTESDAAPDPDLTTDPDSESADTSAPEFAKASETWAEYAGRTITTLSGPLNEAGPQSRTILENLAADAIRVTASARYGRRVHIGLLPTGLIRGTFGDNLVSRREVLKMLPLDEELLTVEVSGKQVERIAGYIARSGDIAISGLRMRVEEGRPRDILIDATSPGPAQTYEICMPAALRYHPAMEEALSGSGSASGYGPDSGSDAGQDAGFDSGNSQGSGKADVPTNHLNATVKGAVMEYLENRPELHPIRDGRLRIRQ